MDNRIQWIPWENVNEGNVAKTVVMGPQVLNIKEGMVSSIIFSRHTKS